MSVVVEPIRFEHHREALGIGESQPRISWKTRTDEPDWRQLGYELRISPADPPGSPPAGAAMLFSTGRLRRVRSCTTTAGSSARAG